MSFQVSAREFQADGLPGNIARDGPQVVTSWILDSRVIAVENIVGRAFTYLSEGVATSADAIGHFVGILGMSRQAVLRGDGSTALAPHYSLQNFENGQIITQGYVYVIADGVGVVGNAVYYSDTTGEIGFGTAGVGQVQIPLAELVFADVADNALCIISLN